MTTRKKNSTADSKYALTPQPPTEGHREYETVHSDTTGSVDLTGWTISRDPIFITMYAESRDVYYTFVSASSVPMITGSANVNSSPYKVSGSYQQVGKLGVVDRLNTGERHTFVVHEDFPVCKFKSVTGNSGSLTFLKS